MPKRHRIKSANIKFVSLCPAGMNGLRTLYKSKDPNERIVTLRPLIKEAEDFEEKGQLVAAVWVPDRADSKGDWANKATIQDMAYSHARNGYAVDLEHNEQPLSKEAAYMAESFIIQEGDPRFVGLVDEAGFSVDATGGWGAVFQVDSPELRKEYREGKWGGVSLAGPALVVEEEPPASARFAKMAKLLGDEIDMEKSEFEAALAKSNKDLLDGLVLALAPKAPPEPAKLIKAEVDLTDPAAVKAHLAGLELAKVDTSDPASLRKHLATLEKSDEPEEGTEDTPELAKAKADLEKSEKALKKAQQRSNQPAGDPAGAAEPEESDLKKCSDLATKMAKSVSSGAN
ncbi:MAG: hypothetical protein JKY94_17545 [Rhodobacteraceae bacterium]|nr:hypothetical protein [Paracoccaceae bacterium]